METSLLNSLLADLIGIAQQSFAGQAKNLQVQDPNVFFGLLTQQMTGSGVNDGQLQEIIRMADAAGTKADIPGSENSVACQTLQTAGMMTLSDTLISLFGEGISDTSYLEKSQGGITPDAAQRSGKTGFACLISGILYLLAMPERSGELENDIDLPQIGELLSHVIEVLSDGDEIEFTRDDTAQDIPAESDTSDRFQYPVANPLPIPFFVMNLMRNPDGGEDPTGQEKLKNILGLAVTGQEGETGKPGPEMPSSGSFIYSEDREITKDSNTVIVDVAKPVERTAILSKTAIRDIRIFESRTLEEGWSGQIVQSVKTEDGELLAGKFDLKENDLGNVDKIIIRIQETEDTETSGNKTDHNEENQAAVHSDNFRHGNDRNNPETKIISKNDFSVMMADKIDKLADSFAGKNTGMEMQVKLKVGENETILVSLRDNGSKVNVDIRGTDENTLNYLQLQKNDLIKNLETRNIMTAIHVGIDQDARHEQQQRERQENKDPGDEDARDFEDFFETMA